jgi:tripartite-type tricarboxylate transporter receptor subunit TctC
MTEALRFVIPNPKGGPFDLAGRAFGGFLAYALDRQLAYENLDDDSAVKGAELVAELPPDGRTLLLGGKGALTSRPHLAASRYQPTDFAALGQIAEAPISIAVRAASYYRTAADLFEAARKSPDSISYSTPHPLHSQRLAMEAFAYDHGLRFKFVTLTGGNQAVMERLADGTLDFTVQAAHNFVRRPIGIRILGIAASKRVPFLPKVPTFAEQGFDLVSALWIGIVCRAGAPAEHLALLRCGMEKTFSNPATAQAIQKLNLIPTFLGHQEYDRNINKDLETHRRVLRGLGVLPA